MNLIRLNKFLSDAGICSRREADLHISAGRVTVNKKVASTGQKVNPESDVIEFDGETIKTQDKLVYYAVYKPRGIISTSLDEKGRKSVTNLVPSGIRVYPIGRLDKESEGLIILTNDGELTNILSHPKNQHEKEYEVTVDFLKNFDFDELRTKFKRGFLIEGKLMKADSVDRFSINRKDKELSFKVILHTGYNRQIRKMCAKMGLQVKKLVRVRFANLTLSKLNIEPGKYKVVSKKEIL